MGIFAWVLVFIYPEIIWTFLLAVYFNHSYVCIWMCGSTHTNIFCLFMATQPNLLLLYPQKQRGLRCFLPVWPTTLPPNYTADTVFAFCTYNDGGPEHSGNLGTTTPEIHIYSNNTVFHSDAQIRINDKESYSQALAHHSSQPALLLCQDVLKVKGNYHITKLYLSIPLQ